MPAVVLNGHNSTGHACFAPTNVTAGTVSRVKINGTIPAVVSPADQYGTHICGKIVHVSAIRTVQQGAPSVFFEGFSVARIGDPLTDSGDFCGQGSNNVFVGEGA